MVRSVVRSVVGTNTVGPGITSVTGYEERTVSVKIIVVGIVTVLHEVSIRVSVSLGKVT